MSKESSRLLIQSLQNPEIYDHPVQHIEVIETHISWVLLTGPYAYKIKKPVNLGFLDFSTLEKRQHYCSEEQRLNARLAQGVYLEVVKITGDSGHPQINGSGDTIEYAIKMKQFPQDAQLDRVLARDALEPQHIDSIADKIAHFHQHIAHADKSSSFGTPKNIEAHCQDNFDEIEAHITDHSDIQCIEALRHWTEKEFAHLNDGMVSRKTVGFIRECHGDLHLRNMALLDDGVLIFDCIEFNDDLRWIDVISEIAFAVMDLQDRGNNRYAWRLLNRYLEITGDYAGLILLPYYLVYRAMVRAKVDCIRAHQEGTSVQEQQAILKEYRSYIKLAQCYTQPSKPVLLITHGLSGSGKTHYAQAILEALPALRIRSDIERKRLFAHEGSVNTHADIAGGIYSAQASRRTYDKLAELATTALQAGFNTIVDATFLKQQQRQQFKALAERLNIPFVLLDMRATQDTLRQRITDRERAGNDASEANIKVLDHQLASIETLSKNETVNRITIDTLCPLNIQNFLQQLKQQLATQSSRQ